MGNEVYANGMELACKAGQGKSICAFPDVCFTPPQTPATPPGIPIPYPNTGMASDTTDGSKTVQVSGQEVMLKNKSYFKKSTGDEAGCAPKKGLVTGQIQGKVYFNAWSMNVKFEGENVVRHLDLTTHNHASPTPNTPPIGFLDRMSLVLVKECDEEREEIRRECNPPEEKAKCPSTDGVDAAKADQQKVWQKFGSGSPQRQVAQEKLDIALEQYAGKIRDDPCLNALQCALVSYDKGNAGGCCPPQTPEHLIPASQFGKGRGKGHATYKAGRAPCICAEGGKSVATHGLMGRGRREYMESKNIPISDTPVWTVGDSAKCGAHAANEVYPHCSPGCIEAQLKKGHERMGVAETDQISSAQEEVQKDLTGIEAELML